MTWALNNPPALWLLPLALLPLLAGVHVRQGYPSLQVIEPDPLSTALEWALRGAGVLAIVALILGFGGAYRGGQTVARLGTGAHLVVLIDRSSSMDNTFAGSLPKGGEDSKSAAARELLTDFVRGRPHDTFGIVAFSTSPMRVLPMTDHKDAVLAGVAAIDRPGLAFTNVGRGLAMALDVQEADTTQAARAIIFVSDGAAVIDHRIQEKLRAAFQRRPISLYWLFLRTAGTRGIFDVPGSIEEDTPQIMPERHLHKFFESLKISYRAFEAENPTALASAITEIGKLEKHPVAYFERIPQQDLAPYAFAVAAASLALLLFAKWSEVRLTGLQGPSP